MIFWITLSHAHITCIPSRIPHQLCLRRFDSMGTILFTSPLEPTVGSLLMIAHHSTSIIQVELFIYQLIAVIRVNRGANSLRTRKCVISFDLSDNLAENSSQSHRSNRIEFIHVQISIHWDKNNGKWCFCWAGRKWSRKLKIFAVHHRFVVRRFLWPMQRTRYIFDWLSHHRMLNEK